MPEKVKIIAKNRKARHDFEILETIEAGIVLTGTEVKSLREGRANLKGSFARIERGEVFLHGTNISEYDMGNRYNHDPQRPRKLLLHKREIWRLMGKVDERGLTLVPLLLYFSKGRAKVELGLAKGKRDHDKRDAIARRDADREAARAIKDAQRL